MESILAALFLTFIAGGKIQWDLRVGGVGMPKRTIGGFFDDGARGQALLVGVGHLISGGRGVDGRLKIV